MRDSTLDIRDIIARYEDLESERFDSFEDGIETDEAQAEWLNTDDGEEFTAIASLLDELRGNGGDEQWRGDWYPITLIEDTYFVEAMRDLVQDIGDLPKEIPSYLEIDWNATAENLRADYSSVEYLGTTYWYR